MLERPLICLLKDIFAIFCVSCLVVDLLEVYQLFLVVVNDMYLALMQKIVTVKLESVRI